jgi:hypothetical protein
MAARLLIITGLLFLKHSFAFVPDFSNYPPAAISCLNNAAITSGCNADSSTVSTSNACLCSNGGGFVTIAAGCIGSSAPGALTNTYSTMLSNCDATNTALTVSLPAFLSAGQASGTLTTSISSTVALISTLPLATSLFVQVSGPSTTSSQGPSTSSQDPSSTPSQSGGKGKLGTSDVIALAVGVPATVFTIIGVFVACTRR